MKNEKNEKKENIISFDLRTIERRLKKGDITKEQYETYKKSIDESPDYNEIDEEILKVEAGLSEKEVIAEEPEPDQEKQNE